MNFVNSFARRQHPFDIAATPINVDSNILSYLAPLSQDYSRRNKAFSVDQQQLTDHDQNWRTDSS